MEQKLGVFYHKERRGDGKWTRKREKYHEEDGDSLIHEEVVERDKMALEVDARKGIQASIPKTRRRLKGDIRYRSR